MPLRFDTLADLAAAPFDAVIDVRSPAEFAEDHIPGAINLPVLDDAQRAEVGTIYVQESKLRARKIGAAYVAENAAAHLRGALADKAGDWRPLVYCWRGGQRSGAFATILRQIGWRAEAIDGGYRSYRRLVAELLYDRAWPARAILLDGDTGVGKTALLGHLAAVGAPVLDLEGAARHRGSVFGDVDGPQPSQKAFESALAATAARLVPDQTVFIEAESYKIGARSAPPALWSAMRAAPRILIRAPLAVRARYLAEEYGALAQTPARLRSYLDRLRPLHSVEVVAGWRRMAAAGDVEALAADLVRRHYDPRYAKKRAAAPPPIAVVDLDAMDAPALAAAAAKILRVAETTRVKESAEAARRRA